MIQGNYPPHEAANLFPMMAPKDLDDLAEDIRANGLMHPIVVFDGAILDGRNRLKACKKAGVKPRFDTLDKCDSPTAYVLSANKHRRHLSKTQLAFVAERSLELFEAEAKGRMVAGGGDPKAGKEIIPDPGQARDHAAKAVGVNPRYVSDAKRIRKEAPEVARMAERNEVTMSQARSLADLPKALRADAIDDMSDGAKPSQAIRKAGLKKSPQQRAQAAQRREQRLAAKKLREFGKRYDYLKSSKHFGPILRLIWDLPEF